MSTKSLKEKEKEKKRGHTPGWPIHTTIRKKKKNKVRVNLAKINLYPSLTNSYGFAFCLLLFALSFFFDICKSPIYDMIQMIDKEKQVLNFVDSLM